MRKLYRTYKNTQFWYSSSHYLESTWQRERLDRQPGSTCSEGLFSVLKVSHTETQLVTHAQETRTLRSQEHKKEEEWERYWRERVKRSQGCKSVKRTVNNIYSNICELNTSNTASTKVHAWLRFINKQDLNLRCREGDRAVESAYKEAFSLSPVREIYPNVRLDHYLLFIIYFKGKTLQTSSNCSDFSHCPISVWCRQAFLGLKKKKVWFLLVVSLGHG